MRANNRPSHALSVGITAVGVLIVSLTTNRYGWFLGGCTAVTYILFAIILGPRLSQVRSPETEAQRLAKEEESQRKATHDAEALEIQQHGVYLQEATDNTPGWAWQGRFLSEWTGMIHPLDQSRVQIIEDKVAELTTKCSLLKLSLSSDQRSAPLDRLLTRRIDSHTRQIAKLLDALPPEETNS